MPNKATPACSCVVQADVPAVTKGTQLLFLIAGRTCDAPRLFEESIGKGATHIYIEKPGGENAAQLRKMRALADKRGVAVIVGYNKNVAEYSRDAVAELRRVVDAAAPLPKVVLEHCNDFAPGEPLLDFLRGPGGEGMLHNMCCHELALACTLFGVRTRAITSIVLDRAGSELVDLGDGRTDWSRVRFTVHMAPSAAAKSAGALSQLTFAADRECAVSPLPHPRDSCRVALSSNARCLRGRHSVLPLGCGGNFSRITLDTGADGSTKSKQYRLPTAKHEKWMIKAQAADPDIRPYFLQQAPEYERLKSTFIQHILGACPPTRFPPAAKRTHQRKEAQELCVTPTQAHSHLPARPHSRTRPCARRCHHAYAAA